ncbi:MAG: S8 family serine peptidase [Xanthomonadales bacterium]|nr:S8 family serine peptidase [Xanthomonadales bacterium]
MMNKILLKFGVVIIVMCLSCEAMAQSDVALATRKAQLLELSDKLKKRDQNNRQLARDYARRAGISVRRELPNGGVLELQRVAPGVGPIFYITNNLDAADTVSTDEVRPGGLAGLNLEGVGMTVAEWDGGAIYEHTDFIGRLTQMDSPASVSGHSTHVAGTLIGAGDGLEPRSKGMAYKAHLNAYDWNSDTAEMAAAAAGGLLISNHSYGIAAGWLYLGGAAPDTWWWIGGAADTDVEDPNFGYYDSESQIWDQIALDAPYYLIVKASGNDRTDIGPSPGEEYTVIDQNGVFLFLSTLPRNFDCAPLGYDCLPTHSGAKNILTVGSVEDVPGGYSPLSGPASVLMSPYSSWGPTDDGRIKPDVMGNGGFLISAWPDSPFYAAAAGTSMAAPNVTGSLLLLQEHYENLHGANNFMRSATLKALAIHTADESGGADGPDYAFGWGMLNTKNAAKVITQDGGDHQIIEASLAAGMTDSVEITVTNINALVTATVVWMDRPGPVVTPSLDPGDLMLVNDLDLRIKVGSNTYYPWILNPANPSAAATTGDNFRDNVEQVEVSGAGTGAYVIEVSHKGSLFNDENQAYSLIISINTVLPTASGSEIDEDFSGGLPAGWSVNTPMGIPWTIKSPVPGGSRLDNLTGGSGQFAMVDNGYIYQTVTSLRTPVLDLSTTSAAVLSFKSAYIYDFLESLNVDASTNGGSNWTNLWKWQGFNPFPTLYTLDLSAAIAGEPNVMLRFRFDAEGWINGEYWQIDDVLLETFGGGGPAGDPPGQASSPYPANPTADMGVDTNLSWTEGVDTLSHDVYFGTNSSLNGGASKGNQASTGYEPGTLANGTTYYWRIDEVNDDGTTTGTVWSFATEAAPVLPGVASGPNPAHGQTGVSNSTGLTWVAGSDTDSHDVYFGTNPSPTFQGNQVSASYNPGLLADSTIYYWRIGEVNANGTTGGSVWSFTTETPPVQPGQASSPNPFDGVPDVSSSPNLAWMAGTDTISHDVYFGTNASPAFQGNQTAAIYTPGALADANTYYWRIDEVNGALKTAGPVWSFTTAAAVSLSFHIAGINVIDEPVKGPRHRGVATVTVTDADGAAVSGVAVSGTFSGDWSGTRSDTTDGSGQIVVVTPAVKNGSVWNFCVDTATSSGWDFDQTVNASLLCGAPPPLPPPATTGSIAGVVKDASSTIAIEGATVSTDTGESGTTDASGSFNLTEVPTGTRTLTVSAAGYDSDSPTTEVVEGSTKTLDVALNPTPVGGGTGTLKGTVISSTGAKLSSVTIVVAGGPSGTTNKGGKYTVQNAPEGSQSVTATHSSGEFYSGSVTIVAGATATLNITLSPSP